MIRLAAHADIPRLVKMGARFISETAYRDHIDCNPTALAGMFRRLIEADEAAIFVSCGEYGMVGMIGVHIFNHPMSGEKIGCEAFWWVEPEARGGGLGLLKRGEAWLKAMGAKRIQMIAPNERVARLYRRRGYSKTEEHYQKDAR